MGCKEYQQQAIEVAFGEAERTIEFERHLETCVGCREEFAAFGFAAKGIEDVPAPPAPSLSNERLYSAIRAQSIRRASPWLPRFAYAAAAASIALAAWLGFNRPTTAQPEYVASADKQFDSAPTGPIEIPETTPIIKVPAVKEIVVAAPSSRPDRTVRRPHARKKSAAPVLPQEVPEELLAVVIGGAEGALDSEAMSMTGASPAMMRAAPPESDVPTDSSIVVIQPQGQATEKSSDDVSIGG